MPVQYTVNSQLSVRRIDEEIFILDRSNNTLHSFNGTGAFVWERVQQGTGVEEIAADLAAAFDVAPDQAREDVFDFLLTLEKAKLASVVTT
jgi:hypothetical protein